MIPSPPQDKGLVPGWLSDRVHGMESNAEVPPDSCTSVPPTKFRVVNSNGRMVGVFDRITYFCNVFVALGRFRHDPRT